MEFVISKPMDSVLFHYSGWNSIFKLGEFEYKRFFFFLSTSYLISKYNVAFREPGTASKITETQATISASFNDYIF